jgi:hypothetical protein
LTCLLLKLSPEKHFLIPSQVGLFAMFLLSHRLKIEFENWNAKVTKINLNHLE